MANPTWEDTEEINEDIPTWEDTAAVETSPTELESFGRGAASGATFGFADELAGAAEAGGKALFGKDKLVDVLDNYRKYRDESRQAFKAAEEKNPASFLAGEVAGGIGTGLATGGAGVAGAVGKTGLKELMKQGAKIGAAQGAASGLGLSEADLAEGDVSGVAKDVALGAGTGYVAGGALPAAMTGLKAGKDLLGKGVDKLIDVSPKPIQMARDAFNLAKEGKSIVGESATKEINQEALDLSEKILQNIDRQYKTGSKMVGKALEKSEKGPQNISSQMRELEKAVMDKKIQPEDIERIQNTLNLYKRQFVKEGVSESGADKALNKMQKIINKAKSESEALGESLTVSEPEIKDGFLQSVLTSTKEASPISPKVQQVNIPADKTLKSGQVISGREKAEQSLQKKLNRSQAKASLLGEDLIQTKPSIQNDVLQSLEILPDSNLNKETSKILQMDIPEDTLSREVFEGWQNMSLQDLQNLKSQFGDLAYNSDKLDAGGKAQASKAYKMITDLIEEKIDPSLKNLYERGNKKMSDVHNASDLFGEINPTGLTEKAKNTFAEKLKSNTDKNANMLNSLSELLGEEGKNLVGESSELATRRFLNRATTTEGGAIGGLVSPRALAVRGGSLAGTVAKSSLNPANITKNLINMSDEAVGGIANRMSSSQDPTIQDFGRKLTNALSSSDKKDRMIWALTQQPAFRQILEQMETEGNQN